MHPTTRIELYHPVSAANAEWTHAKDCASISPMPAFSGDRRVAFRLAASICMLAYRTGLFPVGMPATGEVPHKNTFCPMPGRALIGSPCRPVTACLVFILCDYCCPPGTRILPDTGTGDKTGPALPSRKMAPDCRACGLFFLTLGMTTVWQPPPKRHYTEYKLQKPCAATWPSIGRGVRGFEAWVEDQLISC